MEIHLDRLPLKRVESTEEGGAERFPSEIGTDEKRLDLIRRIDFSWVLDKDSDKAKKKKKKSLKEEAAAPWPWQGLVENLQLAHQELSVIIDLINTVEANDAVTVAGMTRPKQLPNELLSDLSVSAATKLQRLRHLGKYFKQSSKSLDNQVVREARFYGSLIRLQQNWKVKRQRQAAPVKSHEGFNIDLHDISLRDPMLLARPSLMSMVPVDHDPTGMLTLRPPPKSSRSLTFRFLGAKVNPPRKKSFVKKTDDAPAEEIVDQSVHQIHSVLREIHRAIFEEQVFDLVNREIVDSPSGVNVTGMREDYLQLGIGQDTSIYLALTRPDSFEPMTIDKSPNASEFPNPICFEIYLRSILHEHVSSRSVKRRGSDREGIGLLGYFCSAVAHRVFSKKVLSTLENLAERIPYLHLMTHPTWNSRRSSWSIYVKVPQSVSLSNHRRRHHHHHHRHVGIKYQTSIHVSDESISVGGERASNAADVTVVDAHGCDLAELPGILLQQVGTQVIGWLHEEAVNAGVKCGAEFLSLSMELGRGEKVRLGAHLDPDDEMGCISWWLVAAGDDVTDDDVIVQQEDLKVFRKYLGHLSLESLYSVLMDLTRNSNH